MEVISSLVIRMKDIVSTSRESLEKFIRELHSVTSYVNIMRFSIQSNTTDAKNIYY